MKRYYTIFACAVLGSVLNCNSPTESGNNNNNNTTVTGIHGVISKDTVWNSSADEFYIDADLTINANVVWSKKIRVRVAENASVKINGNGKLTICEGVSVKLNTGAFIENGYSSSGTLIAQGSDSLPILFTRNTGVQYWGYSGSGSGGILLYEHSTTQTILDHCIIEYAITGLYVDKAQPKITNCKIRNNKEYGINFEHGSFPADSAFFIKDSITTNGNYPISISAEGLTKLSGDTYFKDNTLNAIRVTGGDIKQSGTWKKHDVSYIFTSPAKVDNVTGVTITINSGVNCKFDAEAYLEIGYNGTATLIANGTAQDSIKFTNTATGSYWGYSGSNKGGLWFGTHTTTNSSIKYCTIENATVGVYVDAPSITICNSNIRNNKGSGIVFNNECSPKDSASFVNNTIIGNGDYAIEIGASSVRNLSGTGSVAGNTKGGIFVTGNTISNNSIWKKHDAAYIVSGQVAIGSTEGVTVTIRPGARIELVQEAFFETGYSGSGSLIAEGTTTDSIIFTGHITGTFWGYTGTDGAGIMMYEGTSSTTSLKYCIIEKATAGIYIDASVSIKNCTIRDNKAYGIGFYKSTTPRTGISDNAFSNNNPDTTTLNN